MKVTVKHLEERIDDQYHRHIIEAGSKRPEKAKPDRWAGYILCEVSHFDFNQKFTHRTIEINSDQLKESLKKIIGDYPGISFETRKIKLSFPLRCLYHYLDELTTHLESLEDAKDSGRDRQKDGSKGKMRATEAANEEKIQGDAEAAIKHLAFFIRFVKTEFQDTITDCKNLTRHGLMNYE